MEKLKIAYLSHFNYGINTYGISSYNEKYLNYMANKGHEIDFYTLKPHKDYKLNRDINYKFTRKIPKNPFYYSYYFIKLPFILNYKDYDIIHTTCGSGLFLKKIDFTTFHHYQKFQITRDFAYFHYLPIKLELNKARHIIAISSFTKSQCIEEEGQNPQKVTTINQGIDCQKFKPRDQEEIRKSLGLPLDIPIGIFIGFLEKRKNPLLLIKIAKKLKKKGIKGKIMVIGKGPLKKTFIRLIKIFNLSKYFIIFDYVNSIEYYYNAADFAIVPSYLEGFGFVYIESVSSGIPFIGFPTGISPEIAKNGFGIIKKSIQDFIAAVVDNFKQPLILETLAHKFIKQNYSLEKTFSKTEELYFSYISKKNNF